MKNVLKFAATAALALSILGPVAAYAAAPGDAKAPAAQATEQATDPAADKEPTYAEKKEAAVSVLSQFRDALNKLPVDELNAELAKLPTFEKAYVDAKGKGDEAAAKAASDGYAASVQNVVKLNMQIGAAMQGAGMINLQLGMMLGADGEKISKEADVVAVSDEVNKRMGAIQAAGKTSQDAVGGLFQSVQAAVQQRMKIEAPKIFNEELNNAVLNHMQTKLAE